MFDRKGVIHWVPTAKEMPEENTPVFAVWVSPLTGAPRIRIASFGGNCKMWRDDVGYLSKKDVLFWSLMPIVKLPKNFHREI